MNWCPAQCAVEFCIWCRLMKQLDLFPPLSDMRERSFSETADMWELFIDGASRNNPGPSGVGIYIQHNGVPTVRAGFYLGVKTNNQAEYAALLIGLVMAIERMGQGDALTITSDSDLLVQQVAGRYRVRDAGLQKLHAQALRLLEGQNYRIRHVLREHNPVADALANRGIDTKTPVPEAILAKVSL